MMPQPVETLISIDGAIIITLVGGYARIFRHFWEFPAPLMLWAKTGY